jgi:glycerol-3-phosphate dehydrogenase
VADTSILGTTDVRVDDPDGPLPTQPEVETLMSEGSVLIPGLGSVGIRRAYAGVRPLYDQAVADAAGAGDRSVTRSHVVIDHAVRDGVENLVSVVGGKVTTYRLMAEQTADLVTRKLGLGGARCTTADEPLPPPEPAKGA